MTTPSPFLPDLTLRVIELTAENVVRRLSEQEVGPLREAIASLSTQLHVLTVCVKGNGTTGLAQRVEKLERARESINSARDQVRGAWKTVGAVCGAVSFLIGTVYGVIRLVQYFRT